MFSGPLDSFDLKGFKYVPQKRQNQRIVYDKVNYNDYCKKNNIDKNKNYHYYRDKGYYNYRNAMKNYGNQIRIKSSSNNKNKFEKKFSDFTKNECGGIKGGYAAKMRKVNNINK